MNPTSVEAGAEVAKSAMETVIAAMSDVFTLSGTVVTEITKQPILLFSWPLVWCPWASTSSLA